MCNTKNECSVHYLNDDGVDQPLLLLLLHAWPCTHVGETHVGKRHRVKKYCRCDDTAGFMIPALVNKSVLDLGSFHLVRTVVAEWHRVEIELQATLYDTAVPHVDCVLGALAVLVLEKT